QALARSARPGRRAGGDRARRRLPHHRAAGMTLRLFAFAACLALGALGGGLLQGATGALVGTMAGAAVWFTVDTWRATRVLRWLKAGQLRGAPSVGGWWGEAAERARRALTARAQL